MGPGVRGGIVRTLSAFAFCFLLAFGLVALGAAGASADHGSVVIASSNAGGDPGNYGSGGSSITPDGRYVVFNSVADNLVSTTVPAGIEEIYRKDLQTGEIVLVSSAQDGTAGDLNSFGPSLISQDGRYVAFQSYATNLGPIIVGSNSQIFRKDLRTGEVVLVSEAFGDESDKDSMFPSISSDGNLVTFMSNATNLVDPVPPAGYPLIYQSNIATGRIQLVSTNSSGEPADNGCRFPEMNSDGRYVVFDSNSTNLIAGYKPYGISQVYRKDLSTGEVILVSANASGETADADSDSAAISPDGSVVAFNSMADNLVSPSPPAGTRQIYAKDLVIGELTPVSATSSGKFGDDNSDSAAVSPEGRFAIFMSWSSNLVSPSPPAGIPQIYRKDLQTGDIMTASTSASGEAADDDCGSPSIGSSGRYVAFDSQASNLVTPAPPVYGEVYRKGLPGLSVAITSDVTADAFVGETITYEFTVTNIGNTALCGVTVSDPLFGAGWNHNVGDLSPGASSEFTQKYKVLEDDMAGLTHTATATGNYAAGSSVSAVASHTLEVNTATWFVAEGSTAGGFDTWILIQNPGDEKCDVNLTFSTEYGPMDPVGMEVRPRSRTTVRVADYVPDTWGVSTIVASTRPVVVERSMYWNRHLVGDGDVPGSPAPYETRSGHANLGVPYETATDSSGSGAAGGTIYFPEGATAGGFDTWILLVNPTTRDTIAKITFMTIEGEAVVDYVSVKALSRRTVHQDDYIPESFEVATEVVSDVPMIAERSTYWDVDASNLGPSDMHGGHSSAGSPSKSTSWYLAEGSTGGGFETYVLLLNPDAEEAMVTVTFLGNSGVAGETTYKMAPRSRATITVSDHVPDSYQVSAVVASNKAVVAERSTYWDKRTAVTACAMRDGHSTVGAIEASDTWMVPEGSTGGGFDSYVLIANPSSETANINVTFMTGEGACDPIPIEVLPGSRYTIRVNDYLPDEFHVSTLLASDRGIVVERALYWDRRESPDIGASEMMGGNSANGMDP